MINGINVNVEINGEEIKPLPEYNDNKPTLYTGNFCGALKINSAVTNGTINSNTITADRLRGGTISCEILRSTEPKNRFIVGTCLKLLINTVKYDLRWRILSSTTAQDPSGNTWVLTANLDKLRGYKRGSIEIMVGYIPENNMYATRKFEERLSELEFVYNCDAKSYKEYITEQLKYQEYKTVQDFCKEHKCEVLINPNNIVLETKNYKYQFGAIDDLLAAIQDYNRFGIAGYNYRANIVYDKVNKRFCKERTIGEKIANELLEFCNV